MNDSLRIVRPLIKGIPVFSLLLALPAVLFAQELGQQTPDPSSKNKPIHHRIWNGVEIEAVGIVHDAASIFTSPFRWDKRDWLTAAGVVAIAGGLYSQEQKIFDAIRDNRGDYPLQPAIKLGSNIEKSALKSINTGYYVGGMVLGAVLKNETIYEISIGTLEAYLIGGVTQQLTWKIAGRARPQRGAGPYTFHTEQGHSFFSGHTSNAFLMATVISMNVDYLPMQFLAWTYAGTIGLQRIAYDKHWPSDVFVGAVHGAVIAHAVVRHRQNRSTALRLQPALLGDRGTPGVGVSFSF
ncbi:phosphatase PAP2 family protein [bacterium]|nr:phosphatase PAP2 family protein [bacterium]